MKPLLAFIGGFVAALGIFGSGVFAAIVFLNAEPVPAQSKGQNMAELWSSVPRPVQKAAQSFERVAGKAMANEVTDTEERHASVRDERHAPPVQETVDPMTTAAVRRDATEQREASPRRVKAAAAHVAWCSHRYRSYRPEDDSYTPYSGGRQRCVSPYSDVLFADDGAGEEAPKLQYVVRVDQARHGKLVPATGPIELSAEHIRSCFSRYRSYRPEDNSYQPFGGGPRQQCL
ncbi:BA14K family protein [Nitratireductor mangrovi]|uniref:Lectin-like protein BA14k n=1 Tax=Nitratireductor mangrovi TaxID=2599600 RepID=A0A6H0DYJ5_9HYPH|nr:BA14K family protein [Nitratireductor mangrovi]QIS94675.1 BA14K family protein [Nitratireductor mangrovi]